MAPPMFESWLRPWVEPTVRNPRDGVPQWVSVYANALTLMLMEQEPE